MHEVCTKEKEIKNSKMERMQKKSQHQLLWEVHTKEKEHKNTKMKECNEELATSTTRSA